MMLLFTYHKVEATRPAAPGPDDFYTIAGSDLAAQIGELQAAGFELAGMSALLSQVPSPPSPHKTALLTFDDGTADHYDIVFPLLQKQGVQAIFFVPTATLDQPGYLTTAQVREMAAQGQTIGCHSHDHIRLDTLPEAEMQKQLATSSAVLAGLIGAPPAIFAPPGGFINDKLRRSVACQGLNGQGLVAIRTMRWGMNRPLHLTALECIPINRHTTRSQFKAFLQDSGSLPLSLHLLYTIKELIKQALPEQGYAGLRNWLSILRPS